MADGAVMDKIVEGLDKAETKLEELLENPLLPPELRASVEAIEQAVETVGDAVERLDAVFENRPIRTAIQRIMEKIRARKAAKAGG